MGHLRPVEMAWDRKQRNGLWNVMSGEMSHTFGLPGSSDWSSSPPFLTSSRVDSIMLVEEGFSVMSVDASDKMLKYALKERWNRRKEPSFDNWGKSVCPGPPRHAPPGSLSALALSCCGAEWFFLRARYSPCQLPSVRGHRQRAGRQLLAGGKLALDALVSQQLLLTD